MEKETLTIDKILAKLGQRKAYYGELHKQQKDIDEYYELTFKAGVPKIYSQVTPPTAREWIDIGVRNFTLDNPRAKVPQRGHSEAARKRDAILESFYNYWLKTIILQIKDGAKKLPLRGEVFIKVELDDTYYGVDLEKMGEKEKERFEERRLFHFPLIVTVVDPINVYASPAHNGLRPVDVIESYNMTVAEALNLCEMRGWKWKTNKKESDTVEWTSYFSDKHRCFLIDKEPVLDPPVQSNFLDFCPYVHAAAGWGQTSYEGKPEYLYRSILYGKQDMLKLESRVLSQTDTLVGRYAWERYKLQGPSLDVIKQVYPDLKVSTNPDEPILETDQVKVEILKGDSPPPGIFQELAVVSAYAQPPQVLSGMRPTGVYSGQHQESLMASAKPIYKDVFKNYEDALGVVMGMGARIIEKVYQHPIAFPNGELKPEDVDEHYDCEVQLLAEPPEATDMRKTLGANLRKGGSISLITELTKYHDMSKEEALDEQAELIAEQAMSQPGALEGTTRDALMRLGMDQQLKEIDEAKKASHFPPPRNVPETMPTGYESVPKQGRVPPGLEAGVTPRETALGGGLG